MEAEDAEEREEDNEEAEEREEAQEREELEEFEELEGHESPEESEEPEEEPENPEEGQQEEPRGESQQQASEKESMPVPVIEPGMVQTRPGPVTFQKASVIVGKAIAKAMARESSVREVHSRSETPEMQDAPMATPESSEGDEEDIQGKVLGFWTWSSKEGCWDSRKDAESQRRILRFKIYHRYSSAY